MAFLLKVTTPSLSYSKPHKTRFIPPAKLPISLLKPPKRTRISCGLIDPDGGKLVSLFVDSSQKELKKRQALSLPRIGLTRIDLEWVHVLSEGWASPLKGFMRESEFLQTLHFNALRIENGAVVNMSVPIVLAVDDEQKGRIGESTKVALVDDSDNTVAILSKYGRFGHFVFEFG